MNLNVLVSAGVVTVLLLMVLTSAMTLSVRKNRQKKREEGATEFIGIGANSRSRRFLAKADKEIQVRDGPLLSIKPEGITIDHELNRRRYVFNLDSGLPLVAMTPVDELIHYLHAAVFHQNKSIERVHKSHGEIPWVQIAFWAAICILGALGIIGGVSAYIATHVHHAG